jgi:3'(2'), 5'-bisphosphate nucleotidase
MRAANIFPRTNMPSSPTAASDRTDLAYAFADLSARAGRIILDVAAAGAVIDLKKDQSPVTNADLRAEEIILEGLARLLPGVPVVAEELAAAGTLPDVGETFLLVDPLDGTREFVAGRPNYTVNVALVENGRPRIAALHAPALGLTYCAADDLAVRAIHAQDVLPTRDLYAPIHTRTPPHERVVLASRGHGDPVTDDFIAALGPVERRRLGSSIKFVYIAEGSADIYPRFAPTMEWDIAAGDAIITAAGGAVLTPEGAPFAYGKADFRNGSFIAWGQTPR